MEYIGGQGFVHRDLSARNVLVYSPVHVEITDFGLAGAPENDLASFNRANILWMAKELLDPSKRPIFNSRTDVWAFGLS